MLIHTLIFQKTNVAAFLIYSSQISEWSSFFSYRWHSQYYLMHWLESVNMPHQSADGYTSQIFQIHTVQCFTTHNTMKSLYESKNSYLSCGLQLEQKKLLTKLIWEQLDRFKRTNSTLETIVKRSNCNNLSSTHSKSSPKGRDYLYVLFLGDGFNHKGSLVFGWKWLNIVSSKV